MNRYEFPSDILSEDLLCQALQPERVDAIRKACREPGAEHHGICIHHHVIDTSCPAITVPSADALISQGVLLYVPDLEQQYQFMSEWIKPGGFMSHQNDYSIYPSFPDAPYWNSHWGCAEWMWNLAKRKQLFVINREPHSRHLKLMEQHGFQLVCEKRIKRVGMPRRKLAAQWRGMSDDDLTTRAAYILAVKNARDGDDRD